MARAFGGEQLVTDYYRRALREIAGVLRDLPNKSPYTEVDDEEMVDHFLKQAIGSSQEGGWELNLLHEVIGPSSRSVEIELPISLGMGNTPTVALQVVKLRLVPRLSNEEALSVRSELGWPQDTDIEIAASFRRQDHTVDIRGRREDIGRLVHAAERMMDLINAEIALHTPGFRSQVLSEVKEWRLRQVQMQADLVQTQRELGIQEGSSSMAPENPATIAVHDLYIEGDALLSRRELVEASTVDVPTLSVGWDYLEQPPGYFRLGGGVVFVRETQGYVIVPGRDQPPLRAIPASLGQSRYRVREATARGGTMIVLILPSGFTLADPAPLPIEGKTFDNRIALFWRVDEHRRAMDVTWTLKPLGTDIAREVERLNTLAISELQSDAKTKGTIVIERRNAARTKDSNRRSLADDLRLSIARGQVIAILGTGVSTRSSGNQSAASWTGLLRDGIEQCVELGKGGREWAERKKEDLDSSDIAGTLSVAEEISTKLGAPNGAEYGRWLHDTVGKFTVQQPDLLRAIKQLNLPIATTNYDTLIELETGLSSITWRDYSHVTQWLRSERLGVLHLHGVWDEPSSVILGIRSYEQILKDAHAQATLRALPLYHNLLFIGFGEGLFDPNFGAFLKWIGDVLSHSHHRHFRLVKASDVETYRNRHSLDGRVVVLPYGEDHDDLTQFLLKLKTD